MRQCLGVGWGGGGGGGGGGPGTVGANLSLPSSPPPVLYIPSCCDSGSGLRIDCANAPHTLCAWTL